MVGVSEATGNADGDSMPGVGCALDSETVVASYGVWGAVAGKGFELAHPFNKAQQQAAINNTASVRTVDSPGGTRIGQVF